MTSQRILISGPSLSVVGAYILTGEPAARPNCIEAFARYDKILRPFVTRIQQLPPGVPWLAHPCSAFGIKMFNATIRLISSRFVRKLGKLFSGKEKSNDDGIRDQTIDHSFNRSSAIS